MTEWEVRDQSPQDQRNSVQLQRVAVCCRRGGIPITADMESQKMETPVKVGGVRKEFRYWGRKCKWKSSQEETIGHTDARGSAKPVAPWDRNLPVVKRPTTAEFPLERSFERPPGEP